MILSDKTLNVIQQALSDEKKKAYKIYIRLQPTCKLKKVRIFIILRSLGEIGQICFTHPDLSFFETRDFKLEIEIFLISESLDIKILKNLEEILEIENKVITKMKKDDFLRLFEEFNSKKGVKAAFPGDISLIQAGKKKSIEQGQIESSIDLNSNPIQLQDQTIILDDKQKDALQEIGNIGTGNAANALARMIDKRVDINIPSVEIAKLYSYVETFSKKNLRLFVGRSSIKGENNATILIISKILDIIKLASLMIVKSGQSEENFREEDINFIDDFSDLYKSAISEQVQIISSYFSLALDNLLGIKLINGTPKMSIDVGNQLPILLKQKFKIKNKVELIIATDIVIRDINLTAKMLFIPEMDTLGKLLDLLDQLL